LRDKASAVVIVGAGVGDKEVFFVGVFGHGGV
jgi:hypothetical protein